MKLINFGHGATDGAIHRPIRVTDITYILHPGPLKNSFTAI